MTMKLADNEKDTGIIRYDRSNTFSNCTTKIIRRWFYKRIYFFCVHKFQCYFYRNKRRRMEQIYIYIYLNKILSFVRIFRNIFFELNFVTN